VLPILFLIYIRGLFKLKAIRFSLYIDNISLIIASISLKKNIRILKREVTKLYKLGANNAIEFNLAKTELIYFTTSKKAKDFSLRLPN